ncbi:uncharacterized protein LOC116778856 isoform X1 [Danaus plexippus]|uniref:uncharacterized protein LOC116778856 isoform X1 n=1 Tax=Danaus plexippus TaxID=13037 RepID=UPI002AB09C22|nr:uncharacterized protein LOC116778856 isoform X1 [Danaus plexippus]
MGAIFVVVLSALLAGIVQTRSLRDLQAEVISDHRGTFEHNVEKRFVNPSLVGGGFSDKEISKIRAKRSEEECEKLRLCRLHARSNRNFFAAFELYFVNRENARLWDHHARSLAECSQRYSCYR